jgi:hypothetical protein
MNRKDQVDAVTTVTPISLIFEKYQNGAITVIEMVFELLLFDYDNTVFDHAPTTGQKLVDAVVASYREQIQRIT